MPMYRIIHEKVCELLYYVVHMTTYIIINCKRPHIIIVHFYRVVQLHIRGKFCASLSVRASDSGQPITHSRQYFMNSTGQKLYHCIIAVSIRYYTVLNNPTILHTKTFFMPECHPRKRILSETKLSHSSLLHPHVLHTSSSTSKYNSIIYSIYSNNLPLV